MTRCYDALQRLTTATRILGGAVNYSYSPSGNILSKSDYGSSYGYQANGCGPHAASSISVVAALGAGTLNYNCDANGNVVTGTGGSANALPVTTTFDASNRPRNAVRGGSMTWGYNALGERDYELNSNPNERYFVGDDFRVVTGAGGVTRHELGPVTVLRNGGVDTVAPVLHDRLGSVINVTNGGVQSIVEYDVYGKPRNGNMSDRTPATLAIPNFLFGFTGHEHADTVQLIHMKGRIFDYNLGRFLSVDPIIGNPLSSQSLNPYSYIGNNPLSGTDPTGYIAEHVDTRSICFTSPGSCGSISGTDSMSALKSMLAGSHEQPHDKMTAQGASSTPDSHQASDIGSNSSIMGKQLAQVAEPTVEEELFGEGARSRGPDEIEAENRAERDLAEPIYKEVNGGRAPLTRDEALDEMHRYDEGYTIPNTIGPGRDGVGRNNQPEDQLNQLYRDLNQKQAEAEAKGGVYLLRDPLTGEVMRTGRTNDFNRRSSEHKGDPALGELNLEPVHKTDVYEQQRGLEQVLHQQYQPSYNKISPISPTNPRRVEYMKAAEDYLKQ